MQKLKLKSLSSGVLATILLLTQCTPEDNQGWEDGSSVQNGIPLPEITATADDFNDEELTKAITPEGVFSWDADESIVAFAIPSDLEIKESTKWTYWKHEYRTDEKLYVENRFAPHSEGQLNSKRRHDWYVMSPYTASITDPTSQRKDVNSFSLEGQIQNIEHPTQHLKDYDIKTGTAYDVKAKESPSFALQHKCAILKIILKNGNDIPMEVTKYRLTAPEDIKIGGEYNVDFEQDGKLTSCSDPEEARNATLKLTNKKVLRPGETYVTYLMVPPFSVQKSDSLKVRISTATVGEIDTSIVFEKAQDFKAGGIYIQHIDFQTEQSIVMVKDLPVKMIRVKAGTFEMGPNVNQIAEATEYEKPVHKVTLTKDYFIAELEVTQRLWELVMGDRPSYFQADNPVEPWKYSDDPDKPVENVTYQRVVNEFLPELERLTGIRFTLPTEAQWEYAAKGGQKSRNYAFSGSYDCDKVAWYGGWDGHSYIDEGNADEMTHRVGQKEPNELGIYDMTGNVMEWTLDGLSYYTSERQTDPQALTEGERRIVRGGSFLDGKKYSRTSIRTYGSEIVKYSDVGIRLAITGETAEKAEIVNEEVKTFTVKGVTFRMKQITPGTLTLGGTSEQGEDAESDEFPVHETTLSHDYYLGEFEVTQELWHAIMGENPSYFQSSNPKIPGKFEDNPLRPVEQISWNDIVYGFLPKLNELTGENFVLPTEAEWEYAARGGENVWETYKYSGSNRLNMVAWHGGEDANSEGQTHSVGLKQPNEFGLYDMTGNVFEWCSDWYGLYHDGPLVNPEGPSEGVYRILRGGCWFSRSQKFCRVSYRYKQIEDWKDSNCGFRLAIRYE